MKTRILSVVLSILLMIVSTGCANKKAVTTDINGTKVTHVYQPFGLFDSDKKNPNVRYEVSVGNVILGIIFIETIVVPVIVFGWYLWEPVGPKIQDPNLIGVVE